MTYKRFLEIGLTLQKQDKVLSDLYKKKIDLIDFVEPYQIIISELLKDVYGEEGYDWFSWFCYEAEYGHRNWSKTPTYGKDEDGNMVKIKEVGEVRWGATDEGGNPICYSWESLYEYLETNHKNK